ncbi:hypothetical protein EKPJFOCH_1058 [Methylobacterium thuringiense]|uniref:DUF2511 domain-containing protein n=2 Tax=Methylobacterium thuringiense TaxID=1003091 RepID=A0ABQ4TGR1_9HYPH|nr:hypothetical protein EKPJFOCH_1058 [Methylobacterium thuringiense]
MLQAIRAATVAMIASGQAFAAPSCGGLVNQDNFLLVRRDESRCGWPFKVEMVGIACIPNSFLGQNAVYAVAKGASYPLNGVAKTSNAIKGFRAGNIKEIAESDNKAASWIGPGLEMCERGGTNFPSAGGN